MKHFILFFLFFESFSITAQSPSIKKWDANSPLTWDDFQGKPESASPLDAVSCLKISYSAKLVKTSQGSKYQFKVEALFNRSLAWVKNGPHSDRTLTHENFHFNIEELHARLMYKALSAIKYSPSYQKDVEKSAALIRKQAAEMHHTYDEESYRCLNIAGQKRWEEYITAELAKLEPCPN